MKFKVMFFARYREALGVEGESIEGDFACIESLRSNLVQRGGAWEVLNESNLMCARNETLCKRDEPLEEGDEVAFFPPVTGG